MRNIKTISTENELKKEILHIELEIGRQKSAIQSEWLLVKESVKPTNLLKGMFNKSSDNNGVKSGLPIMAVKMAAGFLLNRWMVKKPLGVTKMAAGMALQSGLAHLVTKWVAKKFAKKTGTIDGKPASE